MTMLFGLGLTLIVGVLSFYVKTKVSWSLFNPMLFSILLIITVLTLFDIPYADYKAGGDIVLKMLGPITVVLAVPLYQHHDKLKQHAFAIRAFAVTPKRDVVLDAGCETVANCFLDEFQ